MRRPGDKYYTPEWAVDQLLAEIKLEGVVLEPFSGTGQISRAIAVLGHEVITNDINLQDPTHHHLDLYYPNNWNELPNPSWVITNPPFILVDRVIPLAYQKASIGLATLLRLSFLEPTYGRQDFLVQHPPTMIIVLPRISFTGDGKTDSVTTAWFVWLKSQPWAAQRIKIVPKL